MEKWKSKEREIYYYICYNMTVNTHSWIEDPIDKGLFEIGNFFRTRKEAEQMAKQIKKLLSGKYELTERK